MNYLIQNLFDYTVQVLLYLVNKLHIPYKTLNIVIWYCQVVWFLLFNTTKSMFQMGTYLDVDGLY